MKLQMLFTGTVALLLTGCNATNFKASKGAGSSSAASTGSSLSFGTMSTVDPKITKVCETELKHRGLQYGSGFWRKKINLPCGYMGIGFIEVDVEIDAAVNQTCENLAELDNKLEGQSVNRDGAQEDKAPGADGRIGANQQIPVPTDQYAQPDNGFKWHERQRHCAQSNRCASHTQAEALGRFAWMKKCEATVPQFKQFLNGIRRVENCNGAVHTDPAMPANPLADRKYGQAQGLCIFEASGVPFFPLVILDGAAADNAPAQAINTSQAFTKIDDLAGLANQITAACPDPARVAWIDTVCTAGCYSGDQRLLTSAEGKYESILSAKNANTPTLAVLTRASTLESPRFANVKVGRYVASKDDAKETMLSFVTESGARLTVTTNHPLVDGTGVAREASSFKAGEDLVKSDGARDAIVSITRSEIFGKVYNVAPVSLAPEDNLIVSEGLINGSHNFQTVLRSELNRRVLRSHLAKGF